MTLLDVAQPYHAPLAPAVAVVLFFVIVALFLALVALPKDGGR